MNAIQDETFIKSMKLRNRLIRSAAMESMSDASGNPTRLHYKLPEEK